MDDSFTSTEVIASVTVEPHSFDVILSEAFAVRVCFSVAVTEVYPLEQRRYIPSIQGQNF